MKLIQNKKTDIFKTLDEELAYLISLKLDYKTNKKMINKIVEREK